MQTEVQSKFFQDRVPRHWVIGADVSRQRRICEYDYHSLMPRATSAERQLKIRIMTYLVQTQNRLVSVGLSESHFPFKRLREKNDQDLRI
jgi:hypothetical protein